MAFRSCYGAGVGVADLISLRGISISFNRHHILSSISLRLGPKGVLALLKPGNTNGSALMQMILKLMAPSRKIVGHGKGLHVNCMPRGLCLSAALPLAMGHFLHLHPNARGRSVLPTLGHIRTKRLVGTPVRGLSNNRARHMLLTQTLLGHPRLLILSRPARNISMGNRITLCSLVSRLHHRLSYNILVISRSLRLMVTGASRILYLGRRVYYSNAPRIISLRPRFVSVFNPHNTRRLNVCHRRRGRHRSLRKQVILHQKGSHS